jgi:Domain of unknown function (DUF4145)
MTVNKYVSPSFNGSKFSCPWCGACSHQRWSAINLLRQSPGMAINFSPTQYRAAICDHCDDISIWRHDRLAFPSSQLAIEPIADMPKEIKTDFEEALKIFPDSPRSSAALLRLAIQKLCIELGLPGKNLNDDIGELVNRGLPEMVRQSLDVVRVVGNNQVHPGLLDVRDNPEVAELLFGLVNIIVEYMVTNPKRIQALHDRLPAGAQEQILRRDNVSRN